MTDDYDRTDFPSQKYPYDRTVRLTRLREGDYDGMTLSLANKKMVGDPLIKSYIYMESPDDMKRLIVQLVEALVYWENEQS